MPKITDTTPDPTDDMLAAMAPTYAAMRRLTPEDAARVMAAAAILLGIAEDVVDMLRGPDARMGPSEDR